MRNDRTPSESPTELAFTGHMGITRLIKNLVFDFGGVLVDWNPEYLFKDVFSDRAEMDYFLENVCNSTWNEKQDAGRPLSEAIRVLQEKHPEYHDEIRMYYEEWTTTLGGPIAHNVALLEPLKTDFRLFGLSNWSAETFPIAFDMYPFFALFEGIVISGEERLKKPDPRIYRVLLDRYGLNAAECLFIDDNRANVVAAGKLGFETIHLTCGTDLGREMERLGISVPDEIQGREGSSRGGHVAPDAPGNCR